MSDLNNSTPKKIGNFNIPKTVIECKVDTLAFLELLLRKKLVTWDEIEEVREAVVLHMNVMYPELQLSYSSPPPLKDQAPLANEEEKKPLFYSAPPPDLASMSVTPAPTTEATPESKNEPKSAASTSNAPLYASNVNQPKITNAMKPAISEQLKTNPLKTMNTPPRKKI
ncbi:MAG: hypothetical protein U0457_03880 [Candidatus Sericytochromatia bacterium]